MNDPLIAYSLLAQCLDVDNEYKTAAHPHQSSDPSVRPVYRTIISQLPLPSTMDPKSQQPKRQDDALSLLNTAIEVMNLAKEVSSVTPAKAVFGSVSILLAMIRVRVLLSDNLSQVQL